jgi:hypothetical protein
MQGSATPVWLVHVPKQSRFTWEIIPQPGFSHMAPASSRGMRPRCKIFTHPQFSPRNTTQLIALSHEIGMALSTTRAASANANAEACSHTTSLAERGVWACVGVREGTTRAKLTSIVQIEDSREREIRTLRNGKARKEESPGGPVMLVRGGFAPA